MSGNILPAFIKSFVLYTSKKTGSERTYYLKYFQISFDNEIVGNQFNLFKYFREKFLISQKR